MNKYFDLGIERNNPVPRTGQVIGIARHKDDVATLARHHLADGITDALGAPCNQCGLAFQTQIHAFSLVRTSVIDSNGPALYRLPIARA